MDASEHLKPGTTAQAEEATTESGNVTPTPAGIRSRGNRLKDEASLYLRQHAHNPVDWYPWGDEVLKRARAENKPVFLSIGYSSCHWCHVMEREVFERDDVAALLNEHFVSIKVDREERPDIDAAYMDALSMMTGSGGWPLSMFLTSELKPFWGATYVPPERFLAVARRIAELYRADRAQLESAGAELEQLIAADRTPAVGSETPTAEQLTAVAASAEDGFDEAWGGWGHQVKFPVPPRWSFLLHYYRLSGDEQVRRMLRLTLDRIADGGIRDHVGGGFHRYSTDAAWVVPHFEKMLYDNAQLASLYLEAAVALGEPRYREVARDTLDFMLGELLDPDGGFYASFDADSGGEEGSFYVWTPAELKELASERDGEALALLLGVSERGNFEGASVLTRRLSADEVGRRLNLSEDYVAGLWEKYRPKLREYRAGRVAPGLDKKIVTAWNGLALSALARGYTVLGDERYLDAAGRTAEFLWRVHRGEDGALYRSSTGATVSAPAILDDYAMLAGGLLALYEATGEVEQLRRALALIDYPLKHFRHPEAGFYLTPEDQAAPLGRQVKVHDSVEPSGNAALLTALQRAAAITGKREYYEAVERALSAYGAMLGEAGLEMAAWQELALRASAQYYTVVIAGDAEDERTRELLVAAREGLNPQLAVVHVPAEGAGQELAVLAPTLTGKRAADDGAPLAYVCEYGSCQAPVGNAVELRRRRGAGQ